MNEWMVVKLGGSLLENAVLRRNALDSIVDQWRSGARVVLVHGGGKHVDGMLSRVGIEKETVAGLRVTHADSLEIVVSVLAGLVNKTLVAELSALGVDAVGLSGPDGATLHADVHPPIDGIDLGSVGKIREASPALIKTIVAGNFLPVIGSVALGPGGTLLNVNADSAAAAIAVALGAGKLIFLTDVPGLLDDKGHVIERIQSDSVEQMLTYRVVRGGIVPKLQACVDALSGGVREVRICGPADHHILESKGGTSLVAA